MDDGGLEQADQAKRQEEWSGERRERKGSDARRRFEEQCAAQEGQGTK